MELITSDLVGRGEDARREDSGSQWREFQRFFEHNPLVRRSHELPGRQVVSSRGRCGVIQPSPLLWRLWDVVIIISHDKVVVSGCLSRLPALSSFSCLTFDKLHHFRYTLFSLVDIFPDKLVRISDCASVDTAPANEYLAVVFCVARNPATGIFPEEFIF